jgi:hypothetical protein
VAGDAIGAGEDACATSPSALGIDFAEINLCDL